MQKVGPACHTSRTREEAKGFLLVPKLRLGTHGLGSSASPPNGKVPFDLNFEEAELPNSRSQAEHGNEVPETADTSRLSYGRGSFAALTLG